MDAEEEKKLILCKLNNQIFGYVDKSDTEGLKRRTAIIEGLRNLNLLTKEEAEKLSKIISL